MSIIKNLRTYCTDAKARKLKLLELTGKGMDDEAYIKKMYSLMVGKELNLDHPETYTEKLQWLKLHDRRPEYTMMQDKYAIRDYIKKTIGEEYLIPLLGVWDRAEDIDFDNLPNEFVIKCNHDCASVSICRDKKKYDQEAARKKLKACLEKDYYLEGREWAYKDIKRKIIAEKYMHNGDEKVLSDYKFFCFSGKARMVLVASGEAHSSERRLVFYDTDYHYLPIQRGDTPEPESKSEKPDGFDQLIPLAEKLAGNIPFIRVDFYLVEGHPYFGEIAFYPSGGFAAFKPDEWERKIGSWIKLP
ncbi:MAG: glycosyl transferase [Clostridia bacterium]|nr:glycosyl transferase [Clostridia bacterium]